MSRKHFFNSMLYESPGDPTLSDKSNFDVMARKFGQISKVKVFSCS